MSNRKLLSAEDAEAIVSTRLPGWAVEAGELRKVFLFASFEEAWAFMARVALVAERINHHPDWRNVYNRVEVRLSTHDMGGITQMDIDLALSMEQAAGTTMQNADLLS